MAKKTYFVETLCSLTRSLRWNLDAWVVLDNHYHVIIRTNEDQYEVNRLVRPLHSLTAKYFNKVDFTKGRRVWQNYWESSINFENSYLARLRYVHFNPVKHRLVDNPGDYEFSSYRWFLRSADQQLKDKVMTVSTDKLKIRDDY